MIFNCNDLHGVANGEKEALDRYSNLLAKYRDEFLIYGAYIDLKLVWMNQLTREIYYERPRISTGYATYVSCDLRNSNNEIFESMDHDLYMSYAWQIAIFDDAYNEVRVFLDDEVIADVYESMDVCLDYFEHPY